MNTELAWAAGFFDGEGCFYVKRRRKNSRVREAGRVSVLALNIRQNDPRPLDRFAAVFGLTVNGPYTRPDGLSSNPFYVIETSGTRAKWVADQLLEYLSEPKREQLQRCLDSVNGIT